MTIYYLYDGQSTDGRGNPSFLKKTKSLRKAIAHAEKCERDPYCTGEVRVSADGDYDVLSHAELLDLQPYEQSEPLPTTITVWSEY